MARRRKMRALARRRVFEKFRQERSSNLAVQRFRISSGGGAGYLTGSSRDLLLGLPRNSGRPLPWGQRMARHLIREARGL